MHIEELYPLSGFTFSQIETTETGKVLLKAISNSQSAMCPYCHTLSRKRHSVYLRKPQTLPFADTSVRLVLSVQRYICQNPNCGHPTFAERIPNLVDFYSRRTTLLDVLLKGIAFEISAEAVARIGEKLKIKVSADSILRLIRKTDRLPIPKVRILGVDDWASRKGQNYGTILVDLEKHQVIDLLPDRTQHTLRTWLERHPEIEIVSRDRSFEYKAAMDLGAPQATQVVDRWHLLHNLHEKLQEIIPHQLKNGKAEAREKEPPSHQRRKRYFDLVHRLNTQGYSQRVIARALGISRGTVRKYLEIVEVPNWQPHRHPPSRLDLYQEYLHMRWESGCRDITLLWKELQQQGYPGQRKSVAKYLKRFQKSSPLSSHYSLASLFMKDRLQEREQRYLDSLLLDHPKLQEIYKLTQGFRTLISQKNPETLEDWVTETEHCGIKKLQNFAWGLRQDYPAVKAALAYEWSNGQVEGQVNRLKSIKHQMYGRANFDLLRLRVLGPP
jgi:transposase